MIPLGKKMILKKSSLMKILICVGCAGGFIYQSSQFAFLYFSRPTIMDIKVSEPMYLDMPAMTFCNGNPIRRRVYCKEFPDNCFKEDNETICPDHPQFCSNSTDPFYLMFPKSNKLKMSGAMWKHLGHESNSLFVDCHDYTFSREQCNITMNSIFPIQAVTHYRGVINNCYTINFDAKNPRSVSRFSALVLQLGFEADEYFHQMLPMEIYYNVHDPRMVNNPMVDGYTIKPFKIYRITPHETRRTLLPPPFSNCTTTDHQNDDAFDDNFMEAINNMPCLDRCKAMISYKKCGCLDESVQVYVGNVSICKRAKECVSYDERLSCVNTCGTSCQTRTYNLKIKEADFADPEIKISSDGKSTVFSIFMFFLDTSSLTEYTYKPQFQSIEVFSYIGGYVGIWLGISLISVYELMESTLEAFAAKKLKEKKPDNKHRQQPLFHRGTATVKPLKYPCKNYNY